MRLWTVFVTDEIMNNKEKRFLVSDMTASRRSVTGANGEEKEVRVISGYAIRFNEESLVLKCWDEEFVEVIDRSCVTKAFLKECDIKFTMFHEREMLLARWNKGQGSLRLSVDEKGVKFEFDVPDHEYGRYALECVERGDIAGCSFTFIPGDYDTKVVDERTIITHTRFEWLGEMTLESDPAYPTTEAGARSFCEGIHEKQEREKGELQRAA